MRLFYDKNEHALKIFYSAGPRPQAQAPCRGVYGAAGGTPVAELRRRERKEEKWLSWARTAEMPYVNEGAQF